MFDISNADEALKAFIQKHSLRWLVEYASDSPAIQNPYHNPLHCTWVAGAALAIYNDAPDEAGADEQRLALVIGGMMHDYGHFGGLAPKDIVNIDAARRGLYMVKNIIVARHGQTVYEVSDRLIEITEYPFVHVPSTKAECALRDADLLYSLSKDGARIIMEDLRAEVLARRALEGKDPLSRQEMYEQQVKFMNEIVLYTPQAKALVSERLEHTLLEMKALVDAPNYLDRTHH